MVIGRNFRVPVIRQTGARCVVDVVRPCVGQCEIGIAKPTVMRNLLLQTGFQTAKASAAHVRILQNFRETAYSRVRRLVGTTAVARLSVQYPVTPPYLEGIHLNQARKLAGAAPDVIEFDQCACAEIMLQAQVVLENVGCAEVRIDSENAAR